MTRRLILALGLLGIGPAAAADYDVVEKPVATLQADMTAGRVTSEQLVQAYLARIAQVDPSLHAVIATNPDAMAQARALDAERKAKGSRGPLHGIPVLIKDNIETADPMPTTAGSLALRGNFTLRDAPLVARLRAAGAVILGKTNLSEWANMRSTHSISGWSGVGGLTRNPYMLDRNTCGSSAGSGAAATASLGAVAVGTETDGSVICPSSLNGLAGLKPTLGLVSRTHVIPLAHSQDTPGPMGRSVADIAALMTVMAGSDPADPATREADTRKRDYSAAIAGASLRGKRLGVVRNARDAGLAQVYDAAIAVLRGQGAVIVELPDFDDHPGNIGELELLVLRTELKADLNTYLYAAPAAVPTRSLAEVMAFNRAEPRELSLFGQEHFEAAEKTRGLDDPAYRAARATSQKLAADAIDSALRGQRLDAILMPAMGPAWRTDTVRGDVHIGGSSQLPAVSGYPNLTVPMGEVGGLPVGLSFIGTAWSDAQLLALGAAYEAASHARKPPTYITSAESQPGTAAVLSPAP